MKFTKEIRLLQDMLANNVAIRADKTALVCEKQHITYAQIAAMSNRLANALHANGVQAGDRVLFYLLNGVELVVSIFAALKAQAIFSVIDYATTAESLRYIAANCQAAALITYQRQAELTKEMLAELASLRFAVLVGPEETELAPRLLSFEAIQKTYSDDLAQVSAQNGQARIDRDLAYLIHTSGSTGNPKGVMVTHHSSLFTLRSGIEYLGLSDEDVHTSPLPLSFSPGLNQMLQTFLVGGKLILEKSFTFPSMTLKRMAAEQATGFAGVPTLLTLLLQNDLQRYDLSRLRYITSIGAALPTHVIHQIREKLPWVKLYSTYGMAEASFSLGLYPEQVELRPTSVGKPFPGTQAWIVNEADRWLSPNQVGELVLRGGHVRTGYWNDPERTARRFRPGPVPGETVCYTGDMFSMDEEGYFYFVGRDDEVIKSGAKKVALREVENVLYSFPGVLEAAAVGVADPIMGLAVKAFVVPTEQFKDSLSVEALIEHCHKMLEAHKTPREIEICNSLPKTPSGKIIKVNLI